MLTLILLIVMFSIFGGLLKFTAKLTWKVAKFLLVLLFLPLILVAIVLGSVFVAAIPVLAIIGVVALASGKGKVRA